MTAHTLLVWPLHNAGALIVIAGLLVEFVADSKRFSTPDKERLKKRISHTGILIIVLGIAVEIWENGKQSDKLANAITLSSAANERAAQLEQQAAQLNKEASTSRERAAKFELEIEQIKAPRAISGEQRKRFISEANKFPKGAIKVGTRTSDVETSKYADAIIGLLEGAGYTIKNAAHYPFQGGTPAGNSDIAIAFSSRDQIPEHGKGILKGFEVIGVSVAGPG